MEPAQHLLARFGPPLLVIIGIALCAVPLAAWRNGRWIGLAAFLIVGVPVSVAAFLEMRPAVVSNARADTGVAVAHKGGAAAGGERHVRLHSPAQVRTVFVTVPETRRQRANRGLLHSRRQRSGAHRVVLVIPSQIHETGPATKMAAKSRIPPSTLSCTGFARDSDGNWEAGDNTKPFDVGSATNYSIRDEGPIRPGWMSIGGVDLYALLNAKCGAAVRTPR